MDLLAGDVANSTRLVYGGSMSATKMNNGGTLSPDDARALLPAAEQRIADLEARVAELTASPRIEVRSEPRVYSARLVQDRRESTGFRAIGLGSEPRSYVQDLVRFERGGDLAAGERLRRHGRECELDREKRRLDLPADVTYEMAPEQRATTTSYADPPLWINQYFATFPRPERVLSALAPTFDLPAGVSTVNLPRLTTGTDTDPTVPGGAINERAIQDAAVTSSVAVIAGAEPIPQQMLDQSPASAAMDWAVFSDLETSYVFVLEQQLLNGTGANFQLLGLLNNVLTTGYTLNPTITYTDATPTGTELVPFLGQAIAAIGRNRHLPPSRWMMTTSRVGWLASAEDQQNRPLAMQNTDGIGHFDLLTIPVAINDAIRPTYGAGGNEERIIACRPEDYIILESEPTTAVMEEPLSGSLMVRMVLRRSVAALNRYPSSISALVGSGMIPPTGF